MQKSATLVTQLLLQQIPLPSPKLLLAVLVVSPFLQAVAEYRPQPLQPWQLLLSWWR